MSKSFGASRSSLSALSNAPEAEKSPLPQTVRFVRISSGQFGRITSSGRYVIYSKDDLNDKFVSIDYTDYLFLIPSALYNLPLHPSIAWSVEEQYVLSLLFTGGFNSDSSPKGSSCAI